MLGQPTHACWTNQPTESERVPTRRGRGRRLACIDARGRGGGEVVSERRALEPDLDAQRECVHDAQAAGGQPACRELD